MWIRHWQKWPSREPFAHPAYLEAFLAPQEIAICAIQTGGHGGILLPLILRPLSNEPWARDSQAKDATTPYGYGGAFAWGDVEADYFWNALDLWAAEENIVTLFARLSLFPDTVLPFRGETTFVMKNVVRSLELDAEAMLMDHEHKVRKNIKKAERSAVTIEVDPRGERLAEFHAIYNATMSRRGASSGYYFPLPFFQKLIDECPESVVFFHAVLAGEVISTELVLVGVDHTYSFLGGTNEANFDLRPNDLLKHAIIAWSREQGKQFFVLGGGYQPDDGIYRYKTSFAPHDGERPFYIGRRVFDEAANRRLVFQRKSIQPSWHPNEKFFPAYRAPHTEPE